MKHISLVRSLIAEIRRLQSEVEDYEQELCGLNESLGYAENRASEASEKARRAQYEVEEAERTIRYHEDDVRRATHELERAQRYGDQWGIESATRKLHNLG
jgi:chromosome segregation ATPase